MLRLRDRVLGLTIIALDLAYLTNDHGFDKTIGVVLALANLLFTIMNWGKRDTTLTTDRNR